MSLIPLGRLTHPSGPTDDPHFYLADPATTLGPATTPTNDAGGPARVISITLSPFDLRLCERLRARFHGSQLVPSRSEIIKMALAAFDPAEEDLAQALSTVRARDGRRRKMGTGDPASADPAQTPVQPA